MADSITWGELISQARFILQDTDDSRYRYSDSNLLAACHFACVTAKQARSDLFYGRALAEGKNSYCFPAPPYSDSEEIATLKARPAPFPEIYQPPAIMFVAGYAEMVNEEYSGTDRAAALMSTFRNQLSKTGV